MRYFLSWRIDARGWLRSASCGLAFFAGAIFYAWGQENSNFNIGTGFVVDGRGYVLTAYHVIRNKQQVLIGPLENNKWRVAQVVKTEERTDLALLRVHLDRPALSWGHWRDVPKGLEVLVIGYPQPKVQGLSKKITQGIINGERAEGNDEGYFQLSAEVQKGNSGGPVLSPDGLVVGVVQAKLNALSVAEKTGDLAQNVNFGLKSDVALKFLEDTPVTPRARPLDLKLTPRPYETYRRAEASIVAVIGRNLSADKPPADSVPFETSND